jgi:arabinose-5-phosphate isomerase
LHQAVDLLNTRRGRIICTGVGKSGHIARKVAATISSIAHPAQYVHATEAVHGDLGCVSADDTCIAFSHSGNTPELEGIIKHCQWLGVPIIAITSDANSMLGQAATIALPYQIDREAWSRAPTTSTTVQMVIGDCLAVGLAETKGKSEADFAINHPGGSIGKDLHNGHS